METRLLHSWPASAADKQRAEDLIELLTKALRPDPAPAVPSEPDVALLPAPPHLPNFIRAHGFDPVTLSDGSVRFTIPFTSPRGPGDEVHTVRTFKEARDALGY